MKKSIAMILACSMLISTSSILAASENQAGVGDFQEAWPAAQNLAAADSGLPDIGNLPEGEAIDDLNSGAVLSAEEENPSGEVELAASELPPVGTIYYEDDFSGSEINSRIEQSTSAGGSISQKNGKLMIEKSNNISGGWTGVDIYLNEDKTPVTKEEFVTEFTVERTSGLTPVNIRLRAASGDYTGINWDANNVSLYYSDAKGASDNNVHPVENGAEYAKAAKMTVTTYYNLTEQTFTMWINGNLVAQNKYPRYASSKNLQYIRIYVERPTGTLSIDDFKFYDMITYTDAERVQKDYQELDYEAIFSGSEVLPGTIGSDVSLPRKGLNGCKIEWESSNTAIITNDGKVTRPDNSYPENPEVTLTATISYGEEFMTKSFTVKVLKADLSVDDRPVIESMIYENDFSSSELDEHCDFSPNGGSISVEDGALRITRSKNVTDATVADIYARDDKDQNNGVTGRIGIEYTLKKTGTGTVQQRVRRNTWNDFVTITWNSNNTVSFMYTDELGGAVKNYTTPNRYQNELKVTALFDTDSHTVSMWLNGDGVFKDKMARIQPGNQVSYLRIYLEGNNLFTTELDDVKIFNAGLSPLDIVKSDMAWLTTSQILTEPFVKDNIIDADLNLPLEGKYHSAITWTSSDTRYISDTGVITKPVDSEVLPEVTMTAKIKYEGIEAVKTFSFQVLTTYSDAEKLLETEMKEITPERMMSCGDTDPNGIKCSLALSEKGFYGAVISWKSSNRNVITNSGRVIRPRNNMPAETVTLTATLTYGGKSAKKELEFTVLPDDPWVDPAYMSDEDFYGKWENGAWTTVGKLDYTKPELAAVESAAKAGDYEKAKEEMLAYMRIRSVTSPLPLQSRNSGWSNMTMADIYSLQGTNYYQGDAKLTSNDYQTLYIPVADSIAKGGNASYAITAKYNEASEALIASSRHPNPDYRPKIQVTINGKTSIREAVETATIRAGSYKNTNYSDGPDLTAKMFGEFLGDETYKAMLMFDFSDLGASDTVTDVSLILHARLKQSFADAKELLALYEPATFKESKATWNSFTGYVYNFNGLPEGPTWGSVPGSDVEYGYQMPRFYMWRTLVNEYNYTKDEKYAYYMIDAMMDFIKKRGGRQVDYGYGQGWASGDREIFAGFPRSLDTAERTRSWSASMCYLVKSRSMTPEACTTLMKTIWQMDYSLTRSNMTTGNWYQNQQMAILQSSLTFPEFLKSPEWIEGGRRQNEEMFLVTNNYPDGSYVEKTAGYSQSSLGTYIDFKRLLTSRGMDVSPEYDDMLLKSAYYNIQLYGPNGSNLQWGDDGAGERTGEKYPELSKWFGDKTLQYIDSFGQKGEKPDWTSMNFPIGTNTFMRSDWTKNALFLFTQVRGTGGHAHQDDNGVIVIAHDRTLLPDSGIFTYTATDPDRIWGISTAAHNTVEVNNKTGAATGPGVIYDWVTTDGYDFLSQSSTAYEKAGVDHRRSILFIKPDLWIVSDLMTPTNLTAENSYKQLWHMLPDANLTVDGETGIISSNFKTGANILIGSADRDAEVKEEIGRYDFGYQQVVDAKYGYYTKNNIAGKATFDTVLLPDRSNKNKLDVERIDLGVATSEATAIKFDATIDGQKSRFYYLLDYNHQPGSTRTFDQYKTDGKMALVRERQNGKVQEAVLNTGSKIETANGGLLLQTPKNVADISFQQVGARLYFKTTEPTASLNGLQVKLDNVSTVYVNDQAVAFTKEADGTIVLSDIPTVVIPPKDPSGGKGGVGGVSGGGTAPGPVESAEPSAEPEKDAFSDVKGHWAEKFIKELYDKGIVKGNEDGKFNPDESITRAEYLAMMIRAAGIPEKGYTGGFEDVSAGDWYSGVVQAGLDSGIISVDTAFRPNDNITREEMCKILIIAAGEDIDLDVDLKNYEFAYGDADRISGWAVEYVKLASYYGLILGKDNGDFEPLSNATRAETAAVTYRLLEKQE